jgi:hypothetical protein
MVEMLLRDALKEELSRFAESAPDPDEDEPIV